MTQGTMIGRRWFLLVRDGAGPWCFVGSYTTKELADEDHAWHSRQSGRESVLVPIETVASAPALLAALEEAAELVKIARQHFPKSMHDSDRFALENTNAAIGKALAAAKGSA